MIHPEPVSGHCWGTTGPMPGRKLEALALWGLHSALHGFQGEEPLA